MKTIRVRILGHLSSQRYAIYRTVQAALSMVQKDYPDVALDIEEVREIPDILKYTQVFIYPSLMIAEKLVCVGRFPKKEEVIHWFAAAIGPTRD